MTISKEQNIEDSHASSNSLKDSLVVKSQQIQQGDQKEEKQIVQSYRTTNVRWLALGLACMMMMGDYMAYDFPSYLQNAIGQSVFGCEEYSLETPECKRYNNYYVWLYSLQSIPNLVLPFFGGYLVDKIGIRKSMIIFLGIVTFGQFFVAMSGTLAGGWENSKTVFVFMYIGRFIDACGGENAGVAKGAFLSNWFKGKEFAFAFGVTLTCSRLGSVAAGFALPAAYKANEPNLTPALFIPESVCIISLFFVLGIVYLDKKADQQEGVYKKEKSNNQEEGEKVSLMYLKKFPIIYWILAIQVTLNYVGIVTFLQFGNDFLQHKYQNSEEKASHYLTIPFFMSAGATPFIGFLTDRIGKRQFLMLGASSIMFLAHLLFLILPQCPKGEDQCSEFYQIFPLILLGIFYSFFAAVVWPCIPIVVESKYVGTGFGVITCIQNLGLFLAPQLINSILKGTKHQNGGYTWSQVVFVSIGLLCVIISIILIQINNKCGDILGKPSKQKQNDNQNNNNETQQNLSSNQIEQSMVNIELTDISSSGSKSTLDNDSPNSKNQSLQ